MQQNYKHSRGRCCLLQCCTEHKMVGQHAQGNKLCALEKHFPTVMHVQHKTGTSDEQGQQAKGILRDLQSEKILKYLDFIVDVTNVLSTLSKTFQNGELCITDLVTTLETTLPLLNKLKLEKRPSTRSSKRASVKKQVFFRRNH